MRLLSAWIRRRPAQPQAHVSPGTVAGERAAALVAAAHGMQSRASSVLAAGLMIVLGGGALSWYYAHALSRPARARQAAQASLASRAQGEMPLPALGPIEQPVMQAQRVAPPPPVSDLPLSLAPGGAVPMSGEGQPAAKTPAELALERRLSGAVFAPGAPAHPADVAGPLARPEPAMGGGREGAGGASAMTALLEPTATASVSAQRLANPRFLLPKGAFIDCTLETAIDSTLPGMTTCVTAADIFGTDGRVVLLERGTKLVGETRGQVQQGQARLFVLWTQARTPGGVVVPLDSPGTDELGRSGLPGEVDRHFWQRFGAGILISLINGGVQAAVQAVSPAGGTVVYAPSASQDVATEVFKDTLRIPPTITKRNGDRIQVLVARDVDFRSVYELHAAVRP
ncbi:MAG: type IV secretion system protein VirB10 [Proteobacteria bacterium]|nr:type IV secretion system protein VirB10 [Pseudomonadota bacterium]